MKAQWHELMAQRSIQELFDIADDLAKIKTRIGTPQERCGDREAMVGYEKELAFHKYNIDRLVKLLAPTYDEEMARLEREMRLGDYPEMSEDDYNRRLQQPYGLIKDTWEHQKPTPKAIKELEKKPYDPMDDLGRQ